MKAAEDKLIELRPEKAVRIFAGRLLIKLGRFAGKVGCLILLSAVFAADGLCADPVYPPTAPPSKNISDPLMTNLASTNPATTNLPALAAGNTNDAASAKAAASMEALDDKHTLAIGDRLSFRIVEDAEDPKAMVVTDSGEVEVPYIGRYHAVGLTCKQLARALKTELEKDYYKQATVILAVDVNSRTRGRIYIVGPVRAPGPQEIPSDEVLTISKAILRAGGFTDYADTRKVKVTRNGEAPGAKEQKFIVDVGIILETGKQDNDLPLEPGDLIYVPERLVRF